MALSLGLGEGQRAREWQCQYYPIQIDITVYNTTTGTSRHDSMYTNLDCWTTLYRLEKPRVGVNKSNRHSARQVPVVTYLSVSVGASTVIFIGFYGCYSYTVILEGLVAYKLICFSLLYLYAIIWSPKSASRSAPISAVHRLYRHTSLYLNQAGSYFSNALKWYSVVPQQQSLHNEALVTKECVTKLKRGGCFKALGFNPSTIWFTNPTKQVIISSVVCR